MVRTFTVGIIAVSVAFLVGLTTLADGPPDKIEIKALANLYEPSIFDHKAHTKAGYACRRCHHSTLSPPLACSECHDQPVKKKDFSHERHWDYDTCESCHQVKSTTFFACSYCHKIPFDKKKLQVIGLKGALHQNCMECHKENEISTSCTSCHKKRSPKS